MNIEDKLPKAEELFEKHFDKFRNGIFKASLDHYIETGKPSGSLLLSIRDFSHEYTRRVLAASIMALIKEIEELKELLK